MWKILGKVVKKKKMYGQYHSVCSQLDISILFIYDFKKTGRACAKALTVIIEYYGYS